MEGRNCPNCGAPYDINLNKCPYCGTSYYDLPAIDIRIHDKQLRRVNFAKAFYTSYQLEANTQLMLDTLRIYAIKDGCAIQEVDFEIRIEKDKKQYIVPKYNAKFCDYFILNGERLFMCETDVNSKGGFTTMLKYY